ncbi:hypoxanthine-guanine phosphoribosyltransferase [Phocicoccus schoeneichii]|uniref:Hypoxanthine phosphoribosyltransferase n=1 Tax=Phocicoccus schoeneichii TaxID=1812261 RepID=A0A6V7R0V0_9BACL|nr:hypoxanthine phosphoribosyltransferase [Jeotgalicoccus schoeneichii]GGH54552.1 hypoxanthine-guanine phosphoribosyltransferase [Jeotgalicoccus schoeneichii]CAD2070602.1 Hypoxanthine-guanine phosphoribosyltransferase [Jeotgalicoccus schoeneichii]
MTLKNDISEIILTEEEIASLAKSLGEQITKDYEGKKPILVALLKGSIMFMTDLIKNIDTHIEIDFMDVSSYVGTQSSGEVKILKDLSSSIEGRHIIIVEDIVETGNTLNSIIDFLQYRKAASVEICTLLDKPVPSRTLDVEVKYIGTKIPDGFVVGYGLDFNEFYRNLPYIGLLKPELYS